jgi:zinc protease
MHRLFVLLFLGCWAAVAAATAPVFSPLRNDAPRKILSAEGIDEYQLANGLKVLLFADPSKTTATVNITYLVGSKHENYGETGMAHLLEHLVFKGTPTHRNIAQEFARRGMRWNGTTYYDRTNYHASFNASDETLEFALRLEADRMVNSFIAKADLDSEMTVVRNEMERGENDPVRILGQRMLSTAYLWHNYGNSTIGARSDVENVNIERLQAFYRTYYQPDNAVLVVAGNFEADKALRWIGQYFGTIARPTRSLPPLYTVEPAQDGERSVTLRRVADQQRVSLLYHIPAATHADVPALSLLHMMLTNSATGRLYKALVETRKATAVGATAGLFRDPGYLQFNAAATTTADMQQIKDELLQLVEQAHATPFTQEELARVQREVQVGFEKLMQAPEQVAILLSESIAQGDWRMLLVARERIAKATLADVQRVAQTYLRPANRTVGMLLAAGQPERVDIATAPSATELASRYTFNQTVAAGERFEPTPDNLEARVLRKTLPSGIKLAMLPKQNRGDTVTLSINLRWGRLQEMHGRPAASFVAPLLFEGSSNRSKQQIQDDLTAFKSTLSINGGAQGATLTITSERATLLQALAVAEDVLKNPRFEASAFDRIKSQRLAAIEANRRELGTLLSDQQAAYLNQQRELARGDPRYALTLAESTARVQSVTLADVTAFYNAHWGAREASVAVVGGVPQELEAALERMLANYKRDVPPYARFTAPHKNVAAKRFDAQAADKPNALIDIDVYFALNQHDADYWPLVLANRMFGGGQLDNRLGRRVRQQEGLSYGISSRLAVGYWDNRASFGITGTFAPENRERMTAVVMEELEQARTQGFTQAELDTAKTAIVAGWRQSRNNDSALASTLQWQLETGLDFSEFTHNESKLNAVTLEQANAAFCTHIDPARLLLGLAGDFSAMTKPVQKP